MKSSESVHPPRIAQKILYLLKGYQNQYSILQDLNEVFLSIYDEKGRKKANQWYWRQCLGAIPKYLYFTLTWRMAMLKSYCKIILRIIRRSKAYSFINIAGLAIGMASCLLITMWVLDELSFDRFHQNAPDLYRVEQNYEYSGVVEHSIVTPYPLAPLLITEIPEIIDASRFDDNHDGWLFRYGNRAFYQHHIRGVDPSFLTMFSFPLIKGNSQTALDNPYSIVITEDVAHKYFASEDPIGKVFAINNKHNLVVTGILKNLPTNSALQFEVLVPYEFLKKTGRTIERMSTSRIKTFVQLRSGTPVSQVNEKMTDFIVKLTNWTDIEMELMPLTRLHLQSINSDEANIGDIKYVYIFSVVAFFVLLIACVNFMNLSTARSASRAKEVGLRKVTGALRGHIIGQFFGESVAYTVLALVLAILLAATFLPAFNQLSGKAMSLDTPGIGRVLLVMLSMSLLTGMLAGSYPALLLSSFQPVKVLRGEATSGTSGAIFRKVLVVFQYTLSIILIIGTLVVYNQLHFMKNKKLGYEKNRLIYIAMREDIRKSYDSLKKELSEDSRILGVTASSFIPSNIARYTTGVEWDGKEPEAEYLVAVNFVDYNFIQTIKANLLEGRDFSESLATDQSQAYIINKELARLMNKPSVVGENFSMYNKKGIIIGLVEDFHFRTVKKKIEPLAMGILPENFNFVIVRLSQDIPGSLAAVENVWQRLIPGYPFEYRFMDQSFGGIYRTEERVSLVLRYFAILAVFVAGLGLYGLASFMAERRTKEIGIRKTLGASVPQMTLMLCKEFIVLVLLANLISWPIAYFVMFNWLQSFAYRVSIQIPIFALTLALALVIALCSVSFQAVKAAISNPSESLKYE